MANFSRPMTCVIFLAAMAFFLGCDRPRNKIAIKGDVTYRGKAIVEGSILFVPKDITAGTAEGAPILGGKYEFTPGNGLSAGTYLVSISSWEAPAKKPAAGELPGAPRRSRETIPEEYNAKTTRTIEVTPDGPREFNFDLQ